LLKPHTIVTAVIFSAFTMQSVCKVCNSYRSWGYRGGSPTTVRPSDPALWGSCPL